MSTISPPHLPRNSESHLPALPLLMKQQPPRVPMMRLALSGGSGSLLRTDGVLAGLAFHHRAEPNHSLKLGGPHRV